MIMNVKLYDGSVRCRECLDSSQIERDTFEACSYCKRTPQDVSTPVTVEFEAEKSVDDMVAEFEVLTAVLCPDVIDGCDHEGVFTKEDGQVGCADYVGPAFNPDDQAARAAVRIAESRTRSSDRLARNARRRAEKLATTEVPAGSGQNWSSTQRGQAKRSGGVKGELKKRLTF